MKAHYSLSHSVIPVGNSQTVDLLINFKADTALTAEARRPLNLSLVIDRSGSMAGQPLQHAIRAAQSLVEHLTPEDTLSVVTYDDTIATILEPQQVTDKKAIHDLLGKVKAGGCTDLNGGWLKGCEHVRANLSKDKINRVLLLTDGQANSGITDPKLIISDTHQKADEGISTTTLGFGSQFNEDLLIGMANASSGNFYYIQSHDEAADVFRIELESLTSIVAQNLVATLHPEDSVEIASVLNNYKSQAVNGNIEVAMGDVYGVEDKLLALELLIPSQAATGTTSIVSLSYKYRTVTNGNIEHHTGELPVAIRIGTQEEAESTTPNRSVIEQTSRLRIAKAKDEAIELADKGELNAASQKLRNTIEDLKLKLVQESFEIAEEMDQLDHYAHQIENKKYDHLSRKEMKDQSYQARARNRSDLKLRGVATGSAASLEIVSSADQGVLLKCFREGGKLRVRVVSEGYNKDFNVQFPRSIRQEGVSYVADEIQGSSDGSFYRVSGKIRRLVLPGEVDLLAGQGSARAKRSGKAKASAVTGTAADLETTTAVGDGVLVQCVKEGSKLRARVVSDGYDPNFNMRFPKSIREEGILYVVDEVIPGPGGTSYIACGKIRRLIQ